MSGAAHGDDAGSEALADRLMRHMADLQRFARHIGADGADLDDLVQDTLMRVWRARERLTPDVDPRPYLFATCANAWRDRWRKQSKGPDPLAAPDGRAAPEATPPPPEKLEDLRDRLPDEVWRAIQTLAPAHRVVIFLSAVQGLSGREVAEVLGWPGGTVRSVYSRARAALRVALKR